jgi:hypothetical protein
MKINNYFAKKYSENKLYKHVPHQIYVLHFYVENYFFNKTIKCKIFHHKINKPCNSKHQN